MSSSHGVSAAQGDSPDVTPLPKRGPEPLEYIPLGKKRCHSNDESESTSKRVKPSDSSDPKDGFTYMGKCFKPDTKELL